MNSLFLDALVFDDYKVFFFSEGYNALYYMDWNTGRVFYLGSVSTEDLFRDSLYLAMLKSEEQLVLIPFRASKVAIYSIPDGKFEYIDLPNPEDSYFSGAVYADKVFMVGHTVDKVCVVDLKEKKCRYIDYSFGVKKSVDTGRGWFCRKNRTVVGNKYYFSLCKENAFIEIDMETEEVKKYQAAEFPSSIRIMCHEKEDIFWLNEMNTTHVLRWSIRDGLLGDYRYVEPGFEDYRIGDMYFCSDYLWMFPTVGDDVLKFSLRNNQWKISKELKPYGSGTSECRHPIKQPFPVALLNNNEMMIYAGKPNELLKYNVVNGEVVARRIEESIVKKFYVQNKISYYEDEEISLIDFIAAI